MQHRLLTVVILIAALVLYGAGMVAGGSVLFCAGLACELWFWSRLRTHRRDA